MYVCIDCRWSSYSTSTGVLVLVMHFQCLDSTCSVGGGRWEVGGTIVRRPGRPNLIARSCSSTNNYRYTGTIVLDSHTPVLRSTLYIFPPSYCTAEYYSTVQQNSPFHVHVDSTVILYYYWILHSTLHRCMDPMPKSSYIS